jgi:DnaJ-class molecular chaperone
MQFKDYYSTLGVAKTATDKEVKQAYRKLARKHHPDVNPNDKSAESKFKELTEAYEVLGDPEKRRKYDELGANWRMYEQAGAGGPQAGAWNVPFGGAGGGGTYRTMTEEEVREMFGGGDPFSDFFHTFFGGTMGTAGAEAGPRGRTGRTRGARQGRDVEHEIELGLEDAYRGTTRRLSINHDGQRRDVDVRIPPGVGDGSRVRVGGEGEQGTGGAPHGDLYLRIRIPKDPRFDRQGADLYARVPVPVTTAVLGGEADVDAIGGRSLRLKIPPLTQNGQVLRLRGHGMPIVGKPDQYGDFYATVDVQMPARLTPEQRAHFEALKELETGSKNSAA